MSISSQRIYLIKLLRNQGLCGEHLEYVFQALIISRLSHALSAWYVDVKYGLTQKCFMINEILSKADF